MNKRSKINALKEIAEEMDVLDEMLATLVDLLEKKQVITRKEFEDAFRGKIDKIAKLKSYRDIQLGT